MLVGAAIALVVKQPILVLPLAFASHFVFDAVPHFGYKESGFENALKHKLSYVFIAFTLISIAILLLTRSLWTWTIAAAAFLAVAPDLDWMTRYFVFERRGLDPHDTKFSRFHHNIQRYERPWGFLVEVSFFVVGYYLVRRYLV